MKRNKKLGGVVLSVVTAAMMLAAVTACKNTADGDDRAEALADRAVQAM